MSGKTKSTNGLEVNFPVIKRMPPSLMRVVRLPSGKVTLSVWTSRWLGGAAPIEIDPSLYKLTRLKNLTVAQAMTTDK
jgi:hypothetical protein